MSLLTNSNVSSSLIRENVQGSAADLVFRRADLVNFLMAQGAFVKWNGADPQQWNVVYSGNSSAEAFVEGQAISQPGKQSYARASLAPFFLRIAGGVTGRVMDQIANGGTYEDILMLELGKAREDLVKKLDDTLCGSTADQGIQSVIDAGDTYAGLAPGTYTAHASIETAVSGALSVTVLEDNAETGALAKAIPTHILAAQNQITNYNRLAGFSATTSLMRMVPGQSDVGQMQGAGGLAGGYLQGQTSWNGLPWVGIAGLTSTVVLMLDMTPGVRPEFHVFRDFKTEYLPKTSDDTNFVMSIGGAIKCPVRRAHIKLTGVTA